MNTLISANKKPLSMARCGKAIVVTESFSVQVEVKKQAGYYIVLIEEKKVYSAANTADQAWQYLIKYLSIKQYKNVI